MFQSQVIRPAVIFMVVMTADLTGVVYPLVVTGDRAGRLSRVRPTAA